MLTRNRRRQIARPPSPDSSPSSASQLPPDRSPAPAVAVASSSSDEYYSPPTSLTPVRRQGRRRPPSSLASSGQPASNRAPAPGGVVQRMRWTQRMNENVMRAYYGATGGGTNLTAYRSRTLSLFQALEPDFDVSAQRLSDQVRVIQRNRRLDDATLDRLRSEVRISPVVSAPSLTVVPVPGTPPTNLDGEHDDGAIAVSTQCNDLIRSSLEDVIREYRTSPPGLRPRVPRLPMHNKNKAIMGVLDSLLPTYFESSVDLTDTHSILYCAALTACRVANVAIRPNNNATRPKPAVPAWQCRIEQRIAGADTHCKIKILQRGEPVSRSNRLIPKWLCWPHGLSPQYLKDLTGPSAGEAEQNGKAERENRTLFEAARTMMYAKGLPKKLWAEAVQTAAYVLNRTSKSNEPGKTPFETWTMKFEMQNLTNAETVLRIIKSLGSNAQGVDGISLDMIALTLPTTLKAITDIINRSITTRTFPELWRCAIVRPIPKNSNPASAKDLRPISILPCLSKILERVVYSQVIDYLEVNRVLPDLQSGFRQGRGTATALADVVGNILEARDRGEGTILALLDFSRAFDAIDTTLLLSKLAFYGFDNNAVEWFKSYLSGRSQYVEMHKEDGSRVSSSSLHVSRGVPQGSILGPLLYILYSADITKSFVNCKYHMYADDIQLYMSFKADETSLAVQKINEDLHRVVEPSEFNFVSGPCIGCQGRED
ncbi:uncharacterized protein LOC113503948 [Trichoplusia ni]|uniref:Uncharacterized protein LOC113503948 n=1 Tax=Trichoplusia ni TaxID=7111 RepID=A0A7E5WMI1_TRINI|nr:uncharacterized protein LOC113503948 [Trichoplusia ni]